MAQQSSSTASSQSQTNIYPSADQIAQWQNIDASASGLANWMMNNYGNTQMQVAAPTDLMNEYWNQVANNAGMPDVSGTQGQVNNVTGQMGQNMAPTSFNFQPGQVSFNNPFANGTPNVSPGTGVSGLASSYQYNPQQVTGPTVSGAQISAPTGMVGQISGLQQIQAPSLQQYQMGPAQQVTAPNLQNFQMQAAAPVSAASVSGPQSWTDPGTASQYMSPYTQNVINTQLAQAQVQEQQQLQQQKGQAAQAGAFGGSREAIEEANTSIGYQQMAANLEAQGLQNAYQQGQSQFNTQQQMSQQAQLANQQAGLQAALSNQQAQQQANVQNLSSFLQTQGLGAQTGLQSQLANQSAGLTVGQQNLAAQLQTQGLGAQLNMQGQLANQSTGLQSALANQQAQEFGAGQQMQASLANQASTNQANLATAGYNMQGQLANQASGLQAGLLAQQLGFQGSTFNANQQLQSQMANQAAQMQAMGMQYQGGLQSALQTQQLGMQGQIAGGQLGLQGYQLNNQNLMNQGNLDLSSGNLGLGAYNLGLQGMTQLANAANSNQGYAQSIPDTQYANFLNDMGIASQGLNLWSNTMAQNPSWGQTTTNQTYQTGQTDAPTFNWGQLAGAAISAAGQVGKGLAAGAKGGLMSVSPTGDPQFDAPTGLRAVEKFRKRLYAPLRRHHQYPAARRPAVRPEDVIFANSPNSGLGSFAYA